MQNQVGMRRISLVLGQIFLSSRSGGAAIVAPREKYSEHQTEKAATFRATICFVLATKSVVGKFKVHGRPNPPAVLSYAVHCRLDLQAFGTNLEANLAASSFFPWRFCYRAN